MIRKILILLTIVILGWNTAAGQDIDALRKGIERDRKELQRLENLLKTNVASKKSSERELKLIRQTISGRRKIIKNLALLSGGEQTFVAIALLFAILKVNPSPFCIFDEIEAALDEVNVTRVGNYVKKYSREMQIIMISHRRGTMDIADTLYGVTMQQSGVSKVFTLESSDDRELLLK